MGELIESGYGLGEVNQTCEQKRGREQLDAGGSKLNRKRQAIEPPAGRLHGGSERVVQHKRWLNGVGLLARVRDPGVV